MSALENLARYLVSERRRVDQLVNDGGICPPYPTWESAPQEYRDLMLLKAQQILDGDVQ